MLRSNVVGLSAFCFLLVAATADEPVGERAASSSDDVGRDRSTFVDDAKGVDARDVPRVEVVDEPRQFAEPAEEDEAAIPRPLVGPKERIAMGLLRQFVPEENRRTYDSLMRAATEIADIVDRQRGVVPAGGVSDRSPGASRRPNPTQRRAPPAMAGDDRNHDAMRRMIEMKRAEELRQKALKQHQQALEELERARHQVEKAEQDRGLAGDDARSGRSPKPHHFNPFRQHPEHDGHAPRGGTPRRDAPDDGRHLRGGGHDHDHHDHDHDHSDHIHDHHGPAHSLNEPRFEMEQIDREREGLHLEVARIEAHLQRMQLRAQTAATYEPVAIWAIERIIEVYGDDAPELLADMRSDVPSSVVRRYITMRLAELAEADRGRALGPLRDLITDSLGGSEPRGRVQGRENERRGSRK